MTTEVEEVKVSEEKKPLIMDISVYSKMLEKLNLLAQAIKNVEEAESQLVYIECYTTTEEKGGDESSVNIVRFSTDGSIWTEIYPFNKQTTPILEKSVAVKLYDLFNVIKNCTSDDTEIISFRIDESNPDIPMLSVSGYYNDLREYDEVEVKLLIHDMGFPKREFKSSTDKGLITTVEIDHLAMRFIISLNTEHRTNGVNIIIRDRKLLFQSDYHGLRTELVVKSYIDQLFMRDVVVHLPYYFLKLMAGTGSVESIKFNVFEDNVVVEAAGYNFSYDIEHRFEVFDISKEGLEDFCVVDPSNAETVLALTNNINIAAKLSVATIKKMEDQIAEIQVGLEDRYTASILMECIMQSETPIMVDTDILQTIVSNTQVDGLKIQRYSGTNDIYIKFENDLIIKTMAYNHDRFIAYRREEIKKLGK